MVKQAPIALQSFSLTISTYRQWNSSVPVFGGLEGACGKCTQFKTNYINIHDLQMSKAKWSLWYGINFLKEPTASAAQQHDSAISFMYEVSIIHSHFIIVKQNGWLVWNLGERGQGLSPLSPPPPMAPFLNLHEITYENCFINSLMLKAAT